MTAEADFRTDTSYNSGLGAYSKSGAGSKGTVCSNGNISLSGSGAVINGDAHPGMGMMVDLSGGGYVTGSETALTEPLNEPAVNAGNAATVNNNSNIPPTLVLGKTPLDGGGNFTVSGADAILMPSGIYYFSSFTVSGGAGFVTTGPVTIYCVGDVNAGGGFLVNLTDLPVDFQLYAMGSNVSLPASWPFYGVVYAPTAAITRSGGTFDFFGMMIGASLNLGGGGGYHYDQSLSSLMTAQPRAQLVQ